MDKRAVYSPEKYLHSTAKATALQSAAAFWWGQSVRVTLNRLTGFESMESRILPRFIPVHITGPGQ